MGSSVYSIHKGIGKPIVFKGLRAHYIGWLGGGIVGLLLLFAVLHVIGVNAYICLGVILPAGGGMIGYVYRLNNRYGQYGMMKAAAKRKVPKVLRCKSRKVFIKY